MGSPLSLSGISTVRSFDQSYRLIAAVMAYLAASNVRRFDRS